MITAATASSLLADITRTFDPAADVGADVVADLTRLGRYARWLADVAAAEASHRHAVVQAAEQQHIATNSAVTVERKPAQERANAWAAAAASARADVQHLLDTRPA